MSGGFRHELVGLLGFPVSENPTGPMIEAGFAAAGLGWRYLSLEVAPGALGDAVRGARAMGFRGFHCTIPHKVSVREYLDGLGPTAEHTGAVNCVVRRGDDLIGENTDGRGLLDCIREIGDPSDRSAVLLGAGGAARAIAVELAGAGVGAVTIVSRDIGRGLEMRGLCQEAPHPPGQAPRVTAVGWVGDYQVPERCDLLVNATPVGMYPQVEARLPVAVETIPAEAIVADVVANPPVTRLISQARRRGCRTVTGADMLVAQGALSFELWTCQSADRAVLRDALLRALRATAPPGWVGPGPPTATKEEPGTE